jgi:hypothetical protein
VVRYLPIVVRFARRKRKNEQQKMGKYLAAAGKN